MLRPWPLVISLGLTLTWIICITFSAGAQTPISPRALRNMDRDQPPRPGAPDLSRPVNRLVATCTQRIEPDRLQIRVYAARRPVDLPSFTELLIATPVNRRAAIDKLERRSVGLVRSKTNAGRWDVYSDVFGPADGALALADNIFVVRRVLISSRQNPIVVRFDGQSRRLKPGEALLVLG